MAQPSLNERRRAARAFRDEVVKALNEQRDWATHCPAYVALLDQADAELATGDPAQALELVVGAAEAVLDLLVRELHSEDRETVFSAAETLLRLRRVVLGK